MSHIEIYDIDGCICKSIFPNLEEKADIKKLKTKILKTQLYQEFIEYYKRITENNNIKIYFITGRKYKDFGPETKLQLKPLGQDLNIIFYPDIYSHSKFQYFTFKIRSILKIVAELKKIADVSAQTDLGKINIFDDLCQYYPKLLSIAGKLGFSNIDVHIVKDPEQFWKLKLEELLKKTKKKEGDFKTLNFKNKRDE